MMNRNDAIDLCQKFFRKANGKTYFAYVNEKASPGVCYTFDGKPYWGVTTEVNVVFCKTQGVSKIPAPVHEQAFSIQATSPERVQAHWESFLKNEGAFAPLTMAPVVVSNGPGRVYRGKVVRTTKNRVLVSYKFYNGKQAANKWFKLSEVRW